MKHTIARRETAILKGIVSDGAIENPIFRMDIKAEIETLTSIKKMDDNSLAKVNKCGIVNIGISTKVNSQKHNYDFYLDNAGKKNIYITLGSDGEFEKQMQQILFEGGYYYNFPGKTPPAVYNAYTLAAVKAFQKKYGLVQNGIVEQRTWA